MIITWKHYKIWLKELLCASFPEYLSTPQPNNLSIDTRKCLPNSWFIPLEGSSLNGHHFIIQALKEKRILGAFCEKKYFSKIPHPYNKQIVQVTNTLQALQAIAQGWRNELSNITLFAITGSVGKTTSKNMLYHILSEAKQTIASPYNFNNEIGLPLSLLSITPKDRYGVLEFGARRPGDITLLNKIARPQYVICLNVGSAHLGTFGGKEQIYNSKLEIISSAPKHSLCAVFFDDNKLYTKALALKKKIYTFGTNKKSDIYLQRSTWNKDNSMTLTVVVFNKSVTIKLPSAHEAYPSNALSAICLSSLAGLSFNHITKGLSKFQASSGRFHVHQTKNITLIDDSYNASIESVLSGFRSVQKGYPHKKKIIILGNLLELGEKTQEIHEEIGKKCYAYLKPELLITVGDHAKRIALSAKKAGLTTAKSLHFNNIQDLLKENISFENYGSLLYTKGSNAMNLNKIINKLSAH